MKKIQASLKEGLMNGEGQSMRYLLSTMLSPMSRRNTRGYCL